MTDAYIPHTFWDEHAADFWNEPRRYGLGDDHARLGQYLDALAPRSLLLVGVGFGREIPMLAARGRLTVADISRRLIERTRTTHPDVAAVCADVGALPFMADAFDVAVTFACLTHVGPDRLPVALHELMRAAPHIVLVESPGPDGVGAGTWMSGPCNTWTYDMPARLRGIGCTIRGTIATTGAHGGTSAVTWASRGAA